MSEQMVTVGDLKLMAGIIAVSSQRGGIWAAEDLTRVGALYNKITSIVAAIEEQNKPKEGDEPAAESSAGAQKSS